MDHETKKDDNIEEKVRERIKELLDTAKKKKNVLDYQEVRDFFAGLPMGEDEFDKIYSPDNDTKKLVKAADKISALIKCIEELKMGNREFEVAERTVRKSAENLDVPEAQIFLKEFLEGYSLTLDEIK